MSRTSAPRAWRSGLIAAALAGGALTAGTVGTVGTAGAATGTPAAAGSYAYTARLDIDNGAKACSAVLIDRLWIITAATCFTETANPGYPAPAGAPAKRTVATIGRTDLTKTDGVQTEVVELVPRADRDVVLGRLATPVDGIAPVPIATTSPAAGDTLRVAGYGRTAAEWSPLNLHSNTFTVNSLAPTGITITGQSGAAVCKGDNGGPALRTTAGGGAELVGVSSRSWQGGCFGNAAETRTGAIEARVDDLGGWVQDTVRRARTPRDANGDARADAQLAYYHADGSIGFYTALAGRNGGLGEYYGGYKVPVAGGWDRAAMKLVQGDFNGDGRSDLAMLYHRGDGSITLHTAITGTDGLLGAFDVSGTTVPAWGNWDWNAFDLFPGDANGDGRTDVMMAYYHADGAIGFYTALAGSNGALGEFNGGYAVPAGNWARGDMKLVPGDFNGDGRAELALLYHQADGRITQHVSSSNAAGLLGAFTTDGWTVPAGAGWDWNAIQLLPGDANGDGRTDVMMAYYHADGAIGFYTAPAGSNGALGEYTAGYTVPAGSWARGDMKLIPGDFNGDGRAELALLYHQADGRITQHVSSSNAAGLLGAFTTEGWTIPAAGNWDWNAFQLP
ncbi:trypsin-like serine protease [Kitasatospora sp. NPDC056184]|uniref:trypsin-like serine protease n=1 Tax=Kitasatospora sp. NPDC056184 TaxID=3345738 RepID=UPI0035DB1060